jgi:hypothetical protein
VLDNVVAFASFREENLASILREENRGASR